MGILMPQPERCAHNDTADLRLDQSDLPWAQNLEPLRKGKMVERQELRAVAEVALFEPGASSMVDVKQVRDCERAQGQLAGATRDVKVVKIDQCIHLYEALPLIKRTLESAVNVSSKISS